MRFSACYITKNESKNIQRSIDSIKEVVKDIVVVDTGSTDDTVEIAKAAGARTEYFEWIGDFSAARNYALDQTEGEIIFFLDADEWFVPALTKEDGEQIYRIFKDNAGADALQIQINNLNDQGAIKDSGTGNRVIRRSSNLRFIKKIHEILAKPNGAMPQHVSRINWQLHHSGYVEDIMPEKMKRNVELLEDAAKNSADPVERNLQRFYLIREYGNTSNIESAFNNFQIIIKEPELIKKQFQMLHHGFSQLIYKALLLGANPSVRERVSRKEIYRKLVETFLKNIPTYPGSATIELLYRAVYDFKEDYLLENLNAAIEARKKMGYTPLGSYREGEMILNQKAAEACFRRGRLTQAMDYAVESFKETEYNNPISLHVLLLCMRGIAAADIIAFLNSQFDVGNARRLEFLMKGSRMHGFRDVHMYYLDKLIKAELATKFDYLYLFIMYGNFRVAVLSALEMKTEQNAGMIAEILFLAAVCADDESIMRDNAGHLMHYGQLLEAYFAGEKPKETAGVAGRILTDDYGKVALAAGMERADKLRALFAEAQPLLCYQVRAKYCVENGLFEEALEEEPPEPEDLLSNRYVAESLIVLNRCEDALKRLEWLFASGIVDEFLLRYVLTVADRSAEPLKSRAKALYDIYAPANDMYIDLRDAVNTGYITDNTDNKKQKAYRSVTRAQFLRQLAEEEKKPKINGLTELYERAAVMYAEKGMPATAMEYSRAAWAQGHNKEENKKRMAEFFVSLNNKQAQEAVKELE